MLYLFTGTSDYEVQLESQKWRKAFIEKHGDFNLTHIKDFSDVDTNLLSEALMSNSLFASKKLILLDIDTTSRKTADLEKKQELLLKIIPRSSDDTIIVVTFPSPDKRSRFYKELVKISEKVQVYDQKDAQLLSAEIQKKYPGVISTSAIDMLIRYKSGNYQKVVREIEKLLITKQGIEVGDITTYISPELEESIFVLIDGILSKRKQDVFKNLAIISVDTNVYLLYNSLLANIRTTYYIGLLKSKNIPAYTIKSQLNLGNRGFLADKSYAMKFPDIQKLYQELIVIDREMKTGKLLGSEDKDILFEIERVLCRYL